MNVHHSLFNVQTYFPDSAQTINDQESNIANKNNTENQKNEKNQKHEKTIKMIKKLIMKQKHRIILLKHTPTPILKIRTFSLVLPLT
jgi:hypothetical protein